MSEKIIYLIPGDDGLVWCSDPAPTADHVEADAIKYIRADVYEKAIKSIKGHAIACCDFEMLTDLELRLEGI